MLCVECENDPCTCQRQLVCPSDWINQTCSTPGCTVIIRSRIGQQDPGSPVCKWCLEGKSYYRHAESDQQHHFGPLMTKEEFGLDLYEAIELLSGIEMAKKKADLLTENGKIPAAREAELWIQDAEKKLNALLERGTIEPGDMRRLLGIQKPKKPLWRSA